MTKRLVLAADGSIHKQHYDKAFRFDVEKVPVSNLADLAELMMAKLVAAPQRVVIRGLPLAYHNVCRRLEGREHGAFRLDPTGHHWMMLDFDEVALPADLDTSDDAELLTGYLVRRLPPAFHRCSYYWQWSCGHGLDHHSLRAHLFFWCRDAHTDKEFKRWGDTVVNASEKLVDCSVFETVQPNYTAAPLLGDGVADPCGGRRNGFVLGAVDEVVIDIPPLPQKAPRQELPPHEHEPAGDAERWLSGLARIGDDRDGFHEPMRQTICAWALAHHRDEDAAFKAVLRDAVLNAVCDQPRDLLNHYLADHILDASLNGARGLAPRHGLTKPFLT